MNSRNPDRRRLRSLCIGAIVLVAGVVIVFGILYWLDAAVGDPDPIARLGGTVRRDSAPYEGVNRFIDRVLPGFSPRRDGFSRDVIVGVNLSGTDADNRALRSLGRMDHLQELDLSATRIDDAGLVHLAELSRLESLQLNGTAVTGAGLAHLTMLPRLRFLGLSETAVDDAALTPVAGISSLYGLSLIDTNVSDAGLAKLKALNIQVLRLGRYPRVSDDGIHRLVAALPELTVEVFEFDAGNRLARIRSFSSTAEGTSIDVVAYLGWFDATDADLPGLTAYPDLTSLSLAGSRVTDAGLEQLHTLKKLAWVDLTDTQVTAEGEQALKEAFPELKVVPE